MGKDIEIMTYEEIAKARKTNKYGKSYVISTMIEQFRKKFKNKEKSIDDILSKLSFDQKIESST
jgi:hypothetical protein